MWTAPGLCGVERFLMTELGQLDPVRPLVFSGIKPEAATSYGGCISRSVKRKGSSRRSVEATPRKWCLMSECKNIGIIFDATTLLILGGTYIGGPAGIYGVRNEHSGGKVIVRGARIISSAAGGYMARPTEPGDMEISRCTFAGAASYIVEFAADVNLVFKNNVCAKWPSIVFAASCAPVEMDNNVFHGGWTNGIPLVTNNGTKYETLAAWAAASGFDTNSVSADPLLAGSSVTGSCGFTDASPVFALGAGAECLSVVAQRVDLDRYEDAHLKYTE
jgi:hypothetical protein